MKTQYLMQNHDLSNSLVGPPNIEEQDGCESCVHDKKFRSTDIHEGTVVCTSCSLVLLHSTYIHPVMVQKQHFHNEKNETESECYKSNTTFDASNEFMLRDWIHNGRLPMCVMEITMHKYQLYCELFGSSCIARKQVKCDELLATSLFLSLIEEDSQRTPEQISFFTNVPDDRILKIAAHIVSKTRAQISLNKALRPSVWIPLLGCEMFLSYKEQELLKEVSDKMQTCFSFSPITIVLAVAHIFFQSRNKVVANKKALSEIGGVSVPTLSRAIDKMKGQLTNDTRRCP